MKPITAPILIIGGGASGLMAAYELSGADRKVILLEAGAEAGGRIRRLQGEGFLRPVEAGAEFIHGEMPLTLSLLREAGLAYTVVKGNMREFRKGKWVRSTPFSGAWEDLMQRMEQLERDMPLATFLDTLTEEKFRDIRTSVLRYAEGFDLADPLTVSTRFLYREWQQEDGAQYRIVGGYARLVDHLIDACLANGCLIHRSTPVTELDWEQGRVTVRTANDQEFHGSKAIITVSPAILRENIIHFSPSIDEYVRAAGKLGYGTVTKVLLQFKEAFWKGLDDRLGFILSDEVVPTWWTQSPDPDPLLTGWIPGAVMKRLKAATSRELIGQCLSSLASMFNVEAAALREQLNAAKVVDWSAEPFIRGGYSFDTLESMDAKHTLSQPIGGTLYFAGEALYEGPAPGTVEAALASGKQAAQRILTQ